ncbi:unnamed protein product [Parascedosporium putredinis]|uniref:Uncharacterized protein n=1 Tax=Parascedosporium putredinis TaxID=1442378 RepID=A0A9P1MB74_9PEZI|nr:unnamed protein product [Parascedosporium putredinis]CAI7995715.1 unnamed protein product [Parascedosporium putredinis]
MPDIYRETRTYREREDSPSDDERRRTTLRRYKRVVEREREVEPYDDLIYEKEVKRERRRERDRDRDRDHFEDDDRSRGYGYERERERERDRDRDWDRRGPKKAT